MAYKPKYDPAAIIANAQAAQKEQEAKMQQMYKKPQMTTAASSYNPAVAIANAINEQNEYAKNMGYANPYTPSPVVTQPQVNQPQSYLPEQLTQPTQPVQTQQNTAIADKLAAVLKSAYQDSLAANQTQYDNSVNAMKAAYASGESKVNESAKAALREAYINQMQAKRAMPQQLSALGIHGGMAETTAARLANNYADNRGTIEAARLAELGGLNDTLLQNLYAAGNQLASQNSAVQQNYYQQLAEQAIANLTPKVNVETVKYNYRTDPAFIAQYAGIINGSTDKATVEANYEALVNKYGFDGAKALLAAAK